MRKRLLAIGMAAFLWAAGFMGAAVSAATTNSSSGTTTHPDPIWCGLWVGASLDVSHAMDCLANSAASQTPYPSNTPNQSQSTSRSTNTTSRVYAALGDSVAAGLGLPIGNSGNDAQCGRSPYGYPTAVAQTLNLPLINEACSGATAGDLVTQQHMSGPNPAAQLSGAFAYGTPQLITITAGANDAHWQSFVRACYSTDCTRSAYTTVANTYLALLDVKLQYALNSIQSRSAGSPPQVIITGYYNPVSTHCNTTLPQITPSEIAWIQQQTAALNRTIQSAASSHSFATYVPLNFTGHDLCSSDPWIQGMNTSAPLHPTARGQQAIASAVVSAAQ